MITIRSMLAVVVTSLSLVAPAGNAWAESKLGSMKCFRIPGSGVNLIVHSKAKLRCTFSGSAGSEQWYEGDTGVALGLDLKWTVGMAGGSIMDAPLARMSLERGGNFRVGLEDWGSGPSNLEQIERAKDMIVLASEMPGFVDYRSYVSQLGERLAVIWFENHEAVDAWRNHSQHKFAQRYGKEKWYAWFRIEVCDRVRGYGFDRP